MNRIGIGSSYPRRHNLTTRNAFCPQCRRHGQLRTFDARRFFAILFFPLLPREWRHIIDYCSLCRGHSSYPLDAWESARQLSLSGALSAYRAEPSPATGLAAHQQLLALGEAAAAREFAKELEAAYPGSAQVQTHLGEVLASLGQTEAAEARFQQALQTRPDYPAARIGAAYAAIERGERSTARQLLSFLEHPGAAQVFSLEPLETLAIKHQKEGEHLEALEIFERLLAALPSLAQHPGFRATIEISQRVESRTILPPKEHPTGLRRFFRFGPFNLSLGPWLTTRRLKIIAPLVLVVAAIMLGVNFERKYHRTLYVANSYPTALTVHIEGGPAVEVGARSYEPIDLPEGVWRARTTGAVEETVEIPMQTRFWSRWTEYPAWVLNPGGATLLVEEEATLKHGNLILHSRTYHRGARLLALPHVDLPFTPFPHRGNPPGRQKRIGFAAPPHEVFGALVKEQRLEEALDLAEWRLTLFPNEGPLIEQYLRAAAASGNRERLHAYILQAPVSIPLHSLYLSLVRNEPQALAEMRALYETRQAEAPSTYLFLRAQVTPGAAERTELLQQALQADPTHLPARFALAEDAFLLGEWSKAQTWVDEARLPELQATPFYHTLLKAQRLHSTLEEQSFLRRKTHPLDLLAFESEIEMQMIQNRWTDAEETHYMANRAFAKAGKEAERRHIQTRYLYFTRKWAELEALLRDDPAARPLFCLILLTQGRAEEVEALIPPGKEAAQTLPVADLLARSLCWHLQGDPGRAERWTQLTLARLQAESTSATWQLARLLTDGATPEELAAIRVPPETKAATAALLALKNPQDAPAWREVARRFTFGLNPLQSLIQQATTP